MRKSLKERVQEFKAEGIPFMDERQKGDIKDILGKPITIRDYGFINGEDGLYCVFIIDEDKDNFYCGGQVLTTNLKELDEDGYREDINEEGFTIKLYEKVSKNKRKYTAIEYL